MASLQTILRARLTNLRSNPDGTWQAQCPACFARGADKTGNHLKVYPGGAFNCCVGSDETDEKGGHPHNRAIRAFIYEGADASTIAALDLEVVDPEPKLAADPVYPEDMLARLVPDHGYWLGRRISIDVLRSLEGGLAPSDRRSKMSGRYLFPIRDHVTRRIMGWTGRLVLDASFGPTHKHLVKASRAVYPLTVVEEAIRRHRKAVLVEGMGDELACLTAGITPTLMLLGLNLNSRMLGFLVSANLTELVISTNNDPEKVNPATGQSFWPGQEAAAKLYAKLVPFLGEQVVRIRLPQTRKDWCKTLEDDTGELAVFKGELGL